MKYIDKKAWIIIFIQMVIAYANNINKVDPNCVMQMTLDLKSLKVTEDSENGMVKIQYTNPMENTLNIEGRIIENDGEKVVLCLDNLEDYEIR